MQATGRSKRWALAGLAIVAVAVSACGDDSADAPRTTTTVAYERPAPTQTGAVDPSTGTTIAPAGGERLADRLAAVDAGSLVLGADVSADLLTLQFLSVGLDETEAACATRNVVTSLGDALATRPVREVMSGAGIDPQVLISCVPASRLQALAQSGRPDLGRVPAATLRSTLMALGSAGYVSAGLTPTEADCVAGRVVGGFDDSELGALAGTLRLPPEATAAAVPACVTSERVVELGG